MRYSHDIGPFLRNRRLSNDLTYEMIEREIGLSVDFLSSLESGEFSEEYDVYIDGQIRAYAVHLGVSEKKIASFREDAHKTSRQRFLIHKKIQAPIVTSNILFQAIVVTIIGGLIGYIGWQVMAMAGNPQLHIDAPENNQIMANGDFEVIGTTTPGSEVTIDGQSVIVGDEGDFRLPVSLSDGVYVLDIESRNRIGRTSQLELVVIVEASED